MGNRYGPASPRAIKRMRAVVSELATRTGRTTRATYDDLGASESTPWGNRPRPLTGALVAVLTRTAQSELDTIATVRPTTRRAARDR